MATMYITEYEDMVIYPGAISQIPQEPALVVQKVAFTTTTASAALNEATKFVSIQLSANGHVHFAVTPVATNETSRLHEANAVSFHGASGTIKIAAVAA